MKSPREKYEHDPHYRHLVDTIYSLIERADFTPSELREASILAAIIYESRHMTTQRLDPRLTEALEYLDRNFVSNPKQRRRR